MVENLKTMTTSEHKEMTLSEHMRKAVNARWAKTDKAERSKFGKYISSHRANVKAKAKIKKTK